MSIDILQVKKPIRFKYIKVRGRYFDKVGLDPDGALYNPNNYPEDELRAALTTILEEQTAKRKEAARQAVLTRERRQEKKIWEAAAKNVDGVESKGVVIRGELHCFCCHKSLSDPPSIRRGIGPDCWGRVLRAVEQIKDEKERIKYTPIDINEGEIWRDKERPHIQVKIKSIGRHNLHGAVQIGAAYLDELWSSYAMGTDYSFAARWEKVPADDKGATQ